MQHPIPITPFSYTHVSILESIRDAVMVQDLTGKIVFTNQAVKTLLGYDSEDLLNKNSQILIPAIVDAAEKQIEKRILGGDQVGDYETSRIHKNGSLFMALVSVSSVRSSDGRIIGITTILRPLMGQQTTLLEQISHLESVNKELDQFAYLASHDLQEPLRNITNFVSLLGNYAKTSTDPEFIYFLSVIDQSSARMTILIRDLLTYSRIGKNRRIEKVDCGKVIQALLITMAAVIAATQATIQVESMPVIDGDAIEIRQVFYQLITNGLTYKNAIMPPELSIQCAAKPTEWQFSIQDNGIGLEEVYFKKIFLPFQRLHAEEDYAGTGLGLAICQKIIRLNKGMIWVNSRPGLGSEFCFTLPKNAA